MDTYAGYRELKTHQKEGRDFQIIVRRRDPRVAVVAIHGGGIEPGTADIAEGVAGDDYTLYCFKGIKPSGNRVLHLTASRFDEPRAVVLVARADTVVAIHGCRGNRSVIYVGGLDADLSLRIIDALHRAGFDVRQSRRAGLQGIDPANICNRGRSGRGVQLEMSAGLRNEMFDSISHRPVRRKTQRFFAFVTALREALAVHER